MSLVLAACGGGGADPGKNPGEDPRQPASVVDAASAAYLVTESFPAGASGVNAHQLHLIDPASGDVFKSISVGGTNGSHEVAGAFVPAAGQGGVRANASVLFFIRQYNNGERQLFRTPLVGAQAGQETQVSNLVDVCAILETQPARLDGSVSWVRVSRAGPDHDCAFLADNHHALVRSDQGSGIGDSSFDWPFGREDALVWEYTAQGDLAWVYGYSAQFGSLGAVRVTNGEAVAVANGFTGQVVRPFSPYPGSAHQMLVQVGQELRIFTWSNGVAFLGSSVMTLPPLGTLFHLIGADDRGIYVIEGLNVHRIDPQGRISLMTTLPQGEVLESGQTPSALIILQTTAAAAPVTGTPGGNLPIPDVDFKLQVVAKTGDAHTVTIETSAAAELFLAGSAEETVVYGARSQGGYVTLKRFMANQASQAPRTIATDAHYFYGVNERKVDFYGVKGTSHLIWCEVNGLPNNCRADRLRSYGFSTDTVQNLGPSLPPSDPATWDVGSGDIDYIDASYRGILEVMVDGKRASWLMKLDQAQSFKNITLP